jgi:hypothetical protein
MSYGSAIFFRVWGHPLCNPGMGRAHRTNNPRGVAGVVPGWSRGVFMGFAHKYPPRLGGPLGVWLSGLFFNQPRREPYHIRPPPKGLQGGSPEGLLGLFPGCILAFSGVIIYPGINPPGLYYRSGNKTAGGHQSSMQSIEDQGATQSSMQSIEDWGYLKGCSNPGINY